MYLRCSFMGSVRIQYPVPPMSHLFVSIYLYTNTCSPFRAITHPPDHPSIPLISFNSSLHLKIKPITSIQIHNFVLQPGFLHFLFEIVERREEDIVVAVVMSVYLLVCIIFFCFFLRCFLHSPLRVWPCS